MNIQIHVDLDNLWIYESKYCFDASYEYSRLYTEALPALLRLLERSGAKATLFVVGRDLETMPECRDGLRAAIDQGHEIANHTYSHPAHVDALTGEEKRSELARCHELIEDHLGVTPIGFRGTGYYLDADLLAALGELSYRYDSSVLPGLGCQVMRWQARRHRARGVREAFGRGRYLAASPRPTRIAVSGGRELIEVPVGTVPALGLPIHSTVVYALGERYFDLVSRPLLRLGRSFVYLFDAIDTVDLSVAEGPGARLLPLRWPLSRRLALVERILAAFRGRTDRTASELVAGGAIAASPTRLFANAGR